MSAGTFRQLDDETVHRLERHWEDGWNRQDIETVMAPFAADVVFSSPGIAKLTGDPTRTTIEGRDALRAYIEESFRLATGIRYTLTATHVGTDSVVLVYSCGPSGTQNPETQKPETQKAGADSMRVDDDGQIIEWRCHY